MSVRRRGISHGSWRSCAGSIPPPERLAAGAGRRELDAVTRAAIESARDVIDADAATAPWERALGAPA
jgi:hypothetical protein